MEQHIKIGSRVRLLKDIAMCNRTYKVGHEFTVFGSSFRGWDLVDDDNNKIYETLFISDSLECIDTVYERRLKLKKINKKNDK